jgi:predicted O-methyltransferase YrrM
MKRFFKSKLFLIFIDIVASPFSFIAALWLKPISVMIKYLPLHNKIFMTLGLLPVRDHYYQPLINPKKHLTKSLREDRNLPGIDFNIEEQLSVLASFNFNNELELLPVQGGSKLEYYYHNGSFESGDAEYLYNIIRLKKPKKFIEIGSGFSTLIAHKAIQKNEDTCHHICIEPYEMSWLENMGVEVIRKKVEDVDFSIFRSLQKDDILFIDSSHIIRPQGDVLLEYLEILPQLNPGVIVHVHDIFMPKDYLDEFIFTHRFLWNEQYLLEAFLTNNNQYRIIGSLNYLKHHYANELMAKSPQLQKENYREPGSFWMVKN